jgi:hypothetical protein
LGDASHQVLIEALPPILVLHLKRFRYDAAAGGVIKIGKFIQFAPELEIPLGTISPFSRQLRLIVLRDLIVQISWYPLTNDPQSHRITNSMQCFTIMVNLQPADTIRSIFFAQTEMTAVGKLGFISTMKR